MVISRSLWLKNTLNAFDSELLLRIQPDNISKLPKLDLAEILTPGENIYNSYGISRFMLALAGDLNPQLINKTSWFKKVSNVFGVITPKRNVRKRVFVSTSVSHIIGVYINLYLFSFSFFVFKIIAYMVKQTMRYLIRYILKYVILRILLVIIGIMTEVLLIGELPYA
jgi:hypothetical protein